MRYFTVSGNPKEIHHGSLVFMSEKLYLILNWKVEAYGFLLCKYYMLTIFGRKRVFTYAVLCLQKKGKLIEVPLWLHDLFNHSIDGYLRDLAQTSRINLLVSIKFVASIVNKVAFFFLSSGF